jgi:hypothetical protein
VAVLAQNVGMPALLMRALLAAAILACALLNGFSLSPVSDWVDYMLSVTLRGYPYMTRGVINAYITPLAVAVMTLAIAGIPAALYERIRGLQSSTPVSLAIWLVAAALVSLPTIMRLVASDDFN